jgi:hypothetical protein
MKNIVLAVLVSSFLAVGASGCMYGGASATGEKAVIARNDGFLFGILRKVYVCKVTDAGLSACADSEAP